MQKSFGQVESKNENSTAVSVALIAQEDPTNTQKSALLPKLRNVSASTGIQIKLSNSSYYTVEEENEDNSNKSKKASFSVLKKNCKPASGGGRNDSTEYYTDDKYKAYKAGGGRGYHPVRVSEVYSQGYVVIKKLEWGNFSTVWMVKDR